MIIRVPTPFRSSADGYVKLYEDSISTSTSPVTTGSEQRNSSGSDWTKSEDPYYQPSLNVIAANMAYDCRPKSTSDQYSLKKKRCSSSSTSRSSFAVPSVVEFQASLQSSDKRDKSSLPQSASPPILPVNTKCLGSPSLSASSLHGTEGVPPHGIVSDSNRNAGCAIQRSKGIKIQPQICDKSSNNDCKDAVLQQAYSGKPENLSMIASPVMKKENHTVNVELTDWSLDINFTKDEMQPLTVENGKSDAITNTDWVTFGHFDESPDDSLYPKPVSESEATRFFPFPDFVCDEWGTDHVGFDAKRDLVHTKLACQLEMVLGRLVFLERVVDNMGKYIQAKSSTGLRDLSFVDFGLANTGFILEEGDSLDLPKVSDAGRILTKKRMMLRKIVKPRWLAKSYSNKA